MPTKRRSRDTGDIYDKMAAHVYIGNVLYFRPKFSVNCIQCFCCSPTKAALLSAQASDKG